VAVRCEGGIDEHQGRKAALSAALSVMVLFVAHVVAEGATGRATQARTDGRAVRAAHLATDDRATGRAQATADGGFGTAVLVRTYRAGRRATQAGADGCAGAAADLFTDHVTQGSPQATANGGTTVTGESALAHQQAKSKGRQSQTHVKSLGRIIKLDVEWKDVLAVVAVTVAAIIVAIVTVVMTVVAITVAPAIIVIVVVMVVAAGNEQEGGNQRTTGKARYHVIGP